MIDPTTSSPATSRFDIPRDTDSTSISSQDTGSTDNSANSMTSKKKISPKIVVGLLALILTVVGGGAAFLLSETSQDIRQQAAVYTADQCQSLLQVTSSEYYTVILPNCSAKSGTWNLDTCSCDVPNSPSGPVKYKRVN